MNLQVLGAGNEVGKSAIMLEGRKNLVMDYGMKINNEYSECPLYPISAEADAAIISHAHLDHAGGTPALFRKKKIPAFMTDVTLELSAMLIRDSMKIAKKNKCPVPYGKHELKKMIESVNFVNYGEKFKAGGFNCRLFDAGHVPGSAGVLVQSKDKKIFYTGDIQTLESNLLSPCILPPKTDVLITECTYGQKIHPNRKEEMKKFVESVDACVANESQALIPVFAVGRSQEMLMLLERHAELIALDGMAKTACEIVSDYSAKIKDAKKFRRILDKITIIRDHAEREIASKKFPIIITTAGMLTGGPVVHYLRHIKNNPENRVIFNGFLIKGTPGRLLLETGFFDNGEERYKVNCKVERYDLSAHTDRSGLFDIIRKTKPEMVIPVHGDNCKKFAKDVHESFGIEAYAPKNGETVRL